VIDGEITEQDWGRFTAYAKRIRCLVFYDFETIHPSVFIRLNQLADSLPLLPNVKLVNSMPGGAGLLHLLNTSLLELSMCPDDSSAIFPVVWAVLQAVPHRAPSLQRLHVQTSLSKASLNAIFEMSNLRVLSLFGTGLQDLGFFHSLSTLQQLESLTISGFAEPTGFSTPRTSIILPSRPFSALKKLVIEVAPSHIRSLFSFLKHHHLQQLELRSAGHDDVVEVDLASHWPQAIETIGQNFRYLKNLAIISSADDRSLPPSFSIFEPLLDMHDLESVHLVFPCLLFSNDEFKKMAGAWPELQTLRMAGSTGVPNVTVEGLQAFAVCSKLHGLSLPFDARKIPVGDGDQAVSFSKLKTLDAQHSPIESASAAARQLDRIFPSLKTIQSAVHQNIWGEVGDLLRLFKAVRTDQKARDFHLMKRGRFTSRRNQVSPPV
ncbi:hypothetical protein H0H93_015399, partial [Arthromyces matolae]